MLIRKATAADVPNIMQLIHKVVPLMNAAGNFQWDSTYPEVFENDITLSQLWIADIEGNIAGVAAITTDQDAEYADVGWDITQTAIVTHRLAVDPDYRGLGIAAALLNQAEHEAISRSIPLLRIDTNSNNQATQKLFPKLGYRYAGQITLAFRPGLSFYCYESNYHNNQINKSRGGNKGDKVRFFKLVIARNEAIARRQSGVHIRPVQFTIASFLAMTQI